MTHYLIAGAAGYIGSRLAARLLAAGHRVRGLVYSAEDPVVERLAARGMQSGSVISPAPKPSMGLLTRLTLFSISRTGCQSIIRHCYAPLH